MSEGVSVDELVRRGVRHVLELPDEAERAERRRRAAAVVGRYASGCHDVAERHDDYLAEAYADDHLR